MGCQGLEVVYAYTKETLHYLLKILVDMPDNKAIKRNNDLFNTSLSTPIVVVLESGL